MTDTKPVSEVVEELERVRDQLRNRAGFNSCIAPETIMARAATGIDSAIAEIKRGREAKAKAVEEAEQIAKDSVKDYRGATGKYPENTQGFRDWCYGADRAARAIRHARAA